ncbi:MAG: CTP synthase [Candidatus Hydrogenedentes bacterium CG1_02_42_14]|nr:MAG: CTP synthase [Candidatus Hydrogenedentes bacterium CG1_02_42_14]
MPGKIEKVKIVCLTGGVISSLGKGITAAALGNLLKRRGYSIGIMKLDPYINLDPGTMSPFQHGEVYVTADGVETDLDIGHYERFLETDFTKSHNVTAGQIYDSVIRRERAGDYLGKTVQVIPHITDEIKSRILSVAKNFDLLIVEIGGTVGDIESLPFLEAIRQLKREIGQKNIAYLHLTLVPFLETTGEFKTKPTQHSVASLREIGIHPDVVLCRSKKNLDEEVREKISLFGDVELESVVSVPDVSSIYNVPNILKESGFDIRVLELLSLPLEKTNESAEKFGKEWDKFASSLLPHEEKIRVGIVGKYVGLHDAYKSVAEAVVHASAKKNVSSELVWIDSEAVERGIADLAQLDAMIVPGGFGERGVEGKITAIKYARENSLPFLGICLGLQCAITEFARNVCMLPGAHSVEFDEETKYPVIHIMDAQKGLKQKGGTMRLGVYPCRLRKNTIASMSYLKADYSEEEVFERHRHRYEVNNAYRDRLAENGMIFSGLSPDGLLVEIIELPKHKYFVATQFHPEFRSRPTSPHPLFLGLIEAAIKK